MPIVVPVSEWLPDLAPLGSRGAIRADNVVPRTNTYGPFKSLQTFSTNALGSRCMGAIVAIASDGSATNVAADQSALYRLSGTSYGSVTNVSYTTGYTTAVDGHWEFVQWGQTIIATNFNDPPQRLSLGAANFVDLPGAPPQARHIGVVRDFVVLGNTAASPQQVRWSAINNSDSWTADAATLADFQELPGDGGWIQKIVGGEYGLIFQERAVFRMVFVGSPLIFQFDQVLRNIGAISFGSVVSHRNLVFFIATDGIYMYDGSEVVPIGAGKVNDFFLEDLDVANADRIYAQIDPVSQVVAFAYPSVEAVTVGNPDKILLYNWTHRRWSLIRGIDIEVLTWFKALGLTLEQLDTITTDLDSLGFSLDSKTWNAGPIVLAAFNNSHKLATFEGSNMAARVDTEERQLTPFMRSMVTEVWPLVEGQSVSASVVVRARNTLISSPAAGSTLRPNATGFCELRNSARYHRFSINIDAGSEFEHIQGVVVEARAEGQR